MKTKAGVNDTVSFQIKRAPKKKPSLLQKIKKNIISFFSFSVKSNEDLDDDDEEDDDDTFIGNTIKKDHFDGLFFMSRNR